MKKNSSRVKKMVSNLSLLQEETKEVLEYEIGDTYSDKSILSFFEFIKSKGVLANSAVQKKVADYLQLLAEEENYKSVSLEQIQNIYQNLIEINPYDISLYDSLAWYLNNVFDSNKQAKKVARIGIRQAQKKLKTMQKLLTEK